MMIKTDLHFFSVDALPLILQFLQDRGFKFHSHRGVPSNQVRQFESTCLKNFVILKVKYDV